MQTPQNTGAASANVMRMHARITRIASTRSATVADALATIRRSSPRVEGTEIYPSMELNVIRVLFHLPCLKHDEYRI